MQACRKRLEGFAEEMLGSFRDRRQGRWAQVYLRGLLLEGRRKSCQPMAERLPDGNEQNLQQFLNQSPWEWEPVREQIAKKMTAALGGGGCWIVDDTGFPKQGKHSVGVARQYCGTLGKRGNCQVGLSISYATPRGAMPLEWALYLPKEWTDDRARCERVGIPEQVRFQTKWQLALGLIDDLLAWGVPAPEVVVVDAGYGNITGFRQGLAVRQLRYVAEVEHTLVAWTQPQTRDAPMRPRGQQGRPRVPKYRGAPAPENLKAIALSLPRSAWRKVTWREGTKGEMSSRFARLRVQPAHGWQQGTEELALVWLLIQWPEEAKAPTKYWLSDLPEETSMRALVRWAKSRWAVEMNYREMKDHLGLDHFEGRGWAGWHHHVTMVMLAFAFVLTERLRRRKGGQSSPFPRSWAGSSNYSPSGPVSASSAVNPSAGLRAGPLPAVRGMI
jgi:SRSO17 transposase